MGWSKWVADSEAYRRAGGRRRRNYESQRAAHRRLQQVAQLLHDTDDAISNAEIASRLGVHRTTAWRDRQVLKASGTIQLVWPGGKVYVWARGRNPDGIEELAQFCAAVGWS